MTTTTSTPVVRRLAAVALGVACAAGVAVAGQTGATATTHHTAIMCPLGASSTSTASSPTTTPRLQLPPRQVCGGPVV